MIVSLKKAHALSVALAAVTTPAVARIDISKFSQRPVADLIAEARPALGKAIEANLMLIEVRFHLRGLIAKANEPEINALINKRTTIEKALAFLNALPTAKTAPEIEAIEAEREASRTATSSYGSSAPISVTLMTADELDKITGPMKRELADLTEQLVEKNFSTKIELSDELVQYLTGLNLL